MLQLMKKLRALSTIIGNFLNCHSVFGNLKVCRLIGVESIKERPVYCCFASYISREHWVLLVYEHTDFDNIILSVM